MRLPSLSLTPRPSCNSLRQARPAKARVDGPRLDRDPEVKPKVQDKGRHGRHNHVQAHEHPLQVLRVVLLVVERGGRESNQKQKEKRKSVSIATKNHQQNQRAAAGIAVPDRFPI